MSHSVTDVFGVDVYGIDVDARTGCAHYRSNLDVISIRHACCNTWYACIECHRQLADHPSEVWPKSKFHERAILCGVCGTQLTISQYLLDHTRCPNCEASFNPGCSLHHHLYFES